MIVREVAALLEEIAPLGYQENYDNTGLIVGSNSSNVNGILVTLDVTPDVIDEALAKDTNLIVAHHPVIFSGIKRLTGANYTERTIIKAIKHGISIYCAHTNLDSVWNGVSMILAKRIGLTDIKVLAPASDQLVKLTTFVPTSNLADVQLALFSAGAGNIGNYDQCSFNIEGTGTFRAGENSNPFVGNKGENHQEKEVRIEVIVPKPVLSKVIEALLKAHPYEEVAYDIYPILNKNPRAGLGVIGKLAKPQPEVEFLNKLKKHISSGSIRHSPLLGKDIVKVAVCGGSGSSLIGQSISAGADIFITADVKYHQFFDADGKIIIADIGHYESEQFTIDFFYEILTKKFPNFAVLKSNVKTNPINYL
jgi:dinuclear metal center YbgI/SA1388 family protein